MALRISAKIRLNQSIEDPESNARCASRLLGEDRSRVNVRQRGEILEMSKVYRPRIPWRRRTARGYGDSYGLEQKWSGR